MPIDLTKTVAEPFQDIMPGDFFWTRGAGLVGKLIRRGTSSPYAHCGIVVAVTETYLICHEARGKTLRGPGLFVTKRKLGGFEFEAMARVWQNAEQRQIILDTSWGMVRNNLRYDWKTIAVIALATVLPHRWIPIKDPDGRAIICSGHVAQCLRIARPDDYWKYMASLPWWLWPGSLNGSLQRLLWADDRMQA